MTSLSRWSQRPALGVAAVVAALLPGLALVGCGTIPPGSAETKGSPSAPADPGAGTGGGAESPSASPTPDPVSLSANVKNKAKNVGVDTIVKVAASKGTLSKVTLGYTGTQDDASAKVAVKGTLDKTKGTWTASEALDPGEKYTLTMTGASSAGVDAKTTRKFTTEDLTLDEQTNPTIFPGKGDTVGVGMPVVLTFDVPVTDKAEFQKHLSVTTTPKQTGSWSWISATEVHYRPKTYWKPGTKVSVDANLNGVDAGNGVYGQHSRTTSFTIGRSLVTKVNLKTDVAKVYENGRQIRKIYVSGGQPDWETRSGTKLIMAKSPVVRMTNQMIGAKEDYDLQVKWAMRITTSGEFLHAAPWNAAAFGNYNSSHGCVGMSTDDAYWLYQKVIVGDPVVTTGGRETPVLGNGWADWNVSYSQWKKGSAL